MAALRPDAALRQKELRGLGEVYCRGEHVASVHYTLALQDEPGQPHTVGKLEEVAGRIPLDPLFDQLTFYLDDGQTFLDFYVTRTGASLEIREAINNKQRRTTRQRMN